MTLPELIVKSGNRSAGVMYHPWIYRGQLTRIPESLEGGALVDVKLANGRFVGRGYFNPRSEIVVRILSRQERAIDRDFLNEKLTAAFGYRERFVKNGNAYRCVFSEADGLPGLMIDDYAGVYVTQFLTLGMDRFRPWIHEFLESRSAVRGIYEKSDAPSRGNEGLKEVSGWVLKNCADETTIVEGSVKFNVRFEAGHKTGFYLDQRDNRIELAQLGVQGKVLDAFCYTGGFGIHLARSGARVTALDSQKNVLVAAAQNAKLNGLSDDQYRAVEANVFDELKKYDRERRRFDMVILDPPSFVKNKAALEGAVAGFKEILLRSMKILNPGGLLAAFSCSYHFDEPLLLQASLEAAADTRKSLKILKFLKQSADHPVDPFIPETYYLKGFLFLVS